MLEALGPNGFLINVARGSVVDEAALLQRLQSRTLGGAALDVFEEEPKMYCIISFIRTHQRCPSYPKPLTNESARNPLFHSLDNVLLSPHIGSASQETRDGMADLVIANINAVLSGKEPLTPVL